MPYKKQERQLRKSKRIVNEEENDWDDFDDLDENDEENNMDYHRQAWNKNPVRERLNAMHSGEKKRKKNKPANLLGIKDKYVTVYRVEVGKKSSKFMHLNIINGEVQLYIPNKPFYFSDRYKRFRKDVEEYDWYTASKYFLMRSKKRTTDILDDLKMKDLLLDEENNREKDSKSKKKIKIRTDKDRAHTLGNDGFLNFGNALRALNFYRQKTENPKENFPFVIKSFKIPSAVYKAIAEDAISESEVTKNFVYPYNVDKADHNQLGLRPHHMDLISSSIIPGSAKVYSPDQFSDLLDDALNNSPASHKDLKLTRNLLDTGRYKKYK